MGGILQDEKAVAEWHKHYDTINKLGELLQSNPQAVTEFLNAN